MYKTGDLARHDQNGDIIFFWRKSEFVKIRGLRVELGEIETRINSLLNGGRSAVLVRDKDGDPEVVAFVEKGHGHEMSSTNWIRRRLRNFLPSYMFGSPCFENLMKLRSGEGSNPDWQEIPADRIIAIEISHLVVDILEAKRTSSMEFLREPDFPLVNAGFNSVHISFLAASIRKKYGKNITITDLHRPGTTVCGIEEMIAGTKAGEVTKGSSRNLLEDLGAIKKRLPFSTETPPFQFASKTILLTSITGFLGRQMLRFLLQHPSVNRIIGLVRAKDLDQAREKIKQQALIGQWWRDEYQSRIEIWLGDLSKPRLGLHQNNWAALAGKDDQTQIDGIIHNGAKNHASRFPRAITTKPGFIVGTKDEGVVYTDDFLWRLAFSILKLGAISQDLVESHIPVAGVDHVASNTIENLFTAPGSTRIQLLDGVSMATFCDILHSQTGIPIKTMHHGPWMKILQTDVEQAEYDHSFLPLMEWFRANAHDLMGNPSNDYNQHFDEDIKAALVKSTGYMMNIGFLPSVCGWTQKKDVALFSRPG
ncbi:hypothetical protein MW887_008710 [Aspergillus wentii]|nr:hypothetical protein MW887_008710 [Aspergillus wentii]